MPAGVGAALAMVVMVLHALIGAGEAYFTAGAGQVSGHFAVAGRGRGGQLADGSAIDVQRDAACHHLHIFFSQATGQAGIAGGGTGVAGVDTGLVAERGVHGVSPGR